VTRIHVEEDRNVLFIRALRPATHRSEVESTSAELMEICRSITERPSPLSALVIRGGAGGFWLRHPRCAADCDAAATPWTRATTAVGTLPCPTVAVIDGDAIGGGWALALACDLRVMSALGRVGSPEVRWARLPATGVAQRLTRLVGPALAMRMLLLGEIVPAGEAVAMGLANRLAAPDALEACLSALVDELRAAAPIALAYAKEAARYGSDLPLSAGLRVEADLATLLQTTRDRAEGIAAFLVHRAPRFAGG